MTAAERQLEQEMLDQPVCSLQYMLGRLSQKYGFLPQLAVSGNFDEQTLEAVMLFQRELFPPVNGVVNQDVWNAIRNEWIGFELEHAPPRALRGFPSSACPRFWWGWRRSRWTDSTTRSPPQTPGGSRERPDWTRQAK